MPNGVHKRDEFDAATRVMESDLLRVLTDQSSGSEADPDTDASSGPAPHIEIVVVEPVVEEVAKQSAPELPPPAARSAADVAPSPTPGAAGEPPRRGSRVFLIAGVVAAIVLAFDASLFVLHQRRITRPAAAPAAPQPMPKYMVLPFASPPAPVEEAAAEAPAPTIPPPTTRVAAAAVPDSTQSGRAHRHSHHRHGSH